MESKWMGWDTVREIGNGSFGKVYEIQQNDNGKIMKAALKVISVPRSEKEIDDMYDSGYATTERELDQYLDRVVNELIKEVETMFSLKSNENIVRYDSHRIIQHDHWKGVDILIKMELLTPIKQYFRGRNINEYQIIKLGMDICNALKFCHSQNPPVLHRDIKPENIMVDADGRFKLADFGVAKTLDGTASAHTRVGTEGYMAPEVAKKGKSYGCSADVYSLGIVLYKLLNNNRMPFVPAEGTISPHILEDANIKMLSEPITQMPVNASKTLGQVVLKAIAFEAKDRYQSAGEFYNALEKCLSDLGPEKLKADIARPCDIDQQEITPKDEDARGTVVDVNPLGHTIIENVSKSTIVDNSPENKPDLNGTIVESDGNKLTYVEREDRVTIVDNTNTNVTKKQPEEKITKSEADTKSLKNNTATDMGKEPCAAHSSNLKCDQIMDNEKKVNKRKPAIIASIGVLLIAAIVAVVLLVINQKNTTQEMQQTAADAQNKEIKRGDRIFMGSFEQDNEVSNGAEAIEWYVLDVVDNKALVISVDSITAMPFNNTEGEPVTWETSSIRTWLNETFINENFTDLEKDKISVTNIKAEANPDYGISSGNDTQDKIFLLSIGDAKQYFTSDSARLCKPTAYAVANGIYVNAENGCCWWWLRTEGNDNVSIAAINSDGTICSGGHYAHEEAGGISPAMWINID